MFINDTTSLCTQCYRHIPGKIFVEDKAVWIEKTCEEHGTERYLVEKNAEFYLNYVYSKKDIQKVLDAICLDITNRCNLACPHCYQLPDNFSQDPSIDNILKQIKKWPTKKTVVLMGAEPTVRDDLPDLIQGIRDIDDRPVMILTNGVRLARIDYASQFERFDNVLFTFGLNHPDYQGPKIREKQLLGLENCVAHNLPIKNISYTLENFNQLEYCLDEIQYFNSTKRYCDMYRIRVGADIGRCPDHEKMFMSELVSRSKEIADRKGWCFKPRPELGIRAHYPVEIDNVLIKLIQWPDVKTVDLEETQTESWADMLPGFPISPLVHQVLLRDRLVNNNSPLLDIVPERYRMLPCITD